LDREYIVIRDPVFIAGTYDKPVIDFIIETRTNTRPIASEKLHVGETVWIKWKSGPIVMKAEIESWSEGYVSEGNLEEIKEKTIGFLECKTENYWNEISRKESFHFIIIKLKNQQILDKPIYTSNKGYRSSWLIIDSIEKRNAWLSSGNDNTKDSCPMIPLKEKKKRKLKIFMNKIIPRNNKGIQLREIYRMVFEKFGEWYCQPT